ncbi:MAG TPA: hypothetical protein VHZ33_06440 [Trebonia sp.]|jgi:hypothetical protein|nr:hypothetical protein [Trebonia sp.]
MTQHQDLRAELLRRADKDQAARRESGTTSTAAQYFDHFEVPTEAEGPLTVISAGR